MNKTALLLLAFALVFAQDSNAFSIDTSSLEEKLTDNKGEGSENLYGTRNFRTVLKGALYRGGGNNKTNKFGARDNRNPLPEVGLKNLCSSGFSSAIYLYETNFDQAPKQTSCTVDKKEKQLKYTHLSPYNDGLKDIFKLAKEAIEGKRGPVYMHCWNGWHASGLASALALRQFCDLSADEAVAYWNKNTDGNDKDPAFEKIRKQIRSFSPLAEYKITAEQKKRVCF